MTRWGEVLLEINPHSSKTFALYRAKSELKLFARNKARCVYHQQHHRDRRVGVIDRDRAPVPFPRVAYYRHVYNRSSFAHAPPPNSRARMRVNAAFLVTRGPLPGCTRLRHRVTL
jgi:hypothetical protein